MRRENVFGHPWSEKLWNIFCELFHYAHMLEETATNLAEVRLLFVELLLQAFQELSLESVDLFDIAKDGTKLLFSEHVGPLATLFDVTLRETETGSEPVAQTLN